MTSFLRRIPVAVAFMLAFLSLGAHAQATRTWVSGVGDDVNPCSRTAPCKTFAGAISKTATGGEISVLDPGGYGAVTITKSMTISGDGTLGSILNPSTNGVVVNCIAETDCRVVLRNLSIEGGDTGGINGVRFILGRQLHMENITIGSQQQQGVLFEPSGPAYLYMRDVAIRNATGGGIYIKPTGTGTANATLDRVVLDSNGRGLRVEDRSVVTVKNSRAVGYTANGFVGIATAGGGLALTIDNCVAQSNGATGVYSGALSTVYLSNTTVTGNLDGLQAAGGGIISLGGNKIYGNAATNGAPTSTFPTQ